MPWAIRSSWRGYNLSFHLARRHTALARAIDVLQDIESDTGYDTRRGLPDGTLAGVSQTSVCDTC